MAPREGNSIVKHGVLDERLNVHGVKNLKVADVSHNPLSSSQRFKGRNLGNFLGSLDPYFMKLLM